MILAVHFGYFSRRLCCCLIMYFDNLNPTAISFYWVILFANRHQGNICTCWVIPFASPFKRIIHPIFLIILFHLRNRHFFKNARISSERNRLSLIHIEIILGKNIRSRTPWWIDFLSQNLSLLFPHIFQVFIMLIDFTLSQVRIVSLNRMISSDIIHWTW